VEGDPLPPGFSAFGYEINATLEGTYPYKTVTYLNPSVFTVGQATFFDFRIFESDDEFMSIEGYEWQMVKIRVIYDDENAWRHGAWTIYSWFDYYSFNPFDTAGESYSDLEDADIPGLDFPGLRVGGDLINFNGIDYEYYLSTEWIRSEWVGRTLHQVVDLVFLAPAGYDGFVVALFNYGNLDDDDAEQISADFYDEDSLFFRLKS
jgi:hypothetical protein